MTAVNSGSLEKPLSVSTNYAKYVAKDERNITVISMQEGRRSVIEMRKSRT